MISVTKLLFAREYYGDSLRYTKNAHAMRNGAGEGMGPVVVWNSTKTCNLKCRHCYMESDNQKYANELTTDEAKSFIDDLADFHVPVLLFSGGEPLIRPDFFELAEYAQAKGVRPTLSTNGTLITREVAQRIKDIGVGYVGISLDGLQDVNDKFRGVEGAYAKALEKSYLGVKEKYPDKVAAIEQYIADLTAAEKAKETNIDKVSSFTGQMMAKLFAYDENDIWAKDLSSLGFYLGKYIYTLDAYEDLKKDMSKGNYNPLVHIYKEDPKGYEAYCRLTLTTYMAECAKSFERLPIVEYADILRNIIYSGVWTKYDYLQLKDKKNLEEKHD